jgi:formate-dependent nitrite reductase membrane component NrfD
MNTFVDDPQWGWWIILYFYLGGLAAGSYFLATLVELFGNREDLPLVRIGFRLAFPLISICGIFLIVDLDKPERFWHMIFQSEAFPVPIPMLKWWSPMSIGAWALAVFGAFSFLSFVGTLWPDSFLAHALGRGWTGRVFQVAGSAMGFFVASYTGVLLAATNQPTWSVSNWIGALFLTSAASTSIAAVLLLGGHSLAAATRERLERADLWALGLELFIFLIFLASLGSGLALALQTPAGIILVTGTLVLGLLIPLGLHLALGDGQTWRIPAAALSCLAGGLLLRYGVVRAPAELLARFGGIDPTPFQVALLDTWTGKGLLLLTLVLAVKIPVLMWRRWRLSAAATTAVGVVSLVAVLAVVGLAIQSPSAEAGGIGVAFSPEDGRPRGGGEGASAMNRPAVFHLRTKIPDAP